MGIFAVFFGFILAIIGCSAYWRDMYKGKTKPSRITSGLWAFEGLIACAAALSDGVGWAVLPVFTAFLCPFITFVLSFVFKQAKWEVTPFDWGCGAMSLIGLLLWAITKNPSVAILFAIFADGLAALPTVKKSWTHPHTETFISYLLPVFSYSTVFFVLEKHSFTEMAFAVYSMIICGGIAFIILLRRYRQSILKAV